MKHLSKCKKVKINTYNNAVSIKFDHRRMTLFKEGGLNGLIMGILAPEIKANPVLWSTDHGLSQICLALSDEGVEALFVTLYAYLNKEEEK